MGRHRNMSQMKEQDKSLEKELNEIEASNLPHTEFKKQLYRCSRSLVKTSTKR